MTFRQIIHQTGNKGGTHRQTCLEKTTEHCHISRANERPDLGFAGCVHELLNTNFAPPIRFSEHDRQPWQRGMSKTAIPPVASAIRPFCHIERYL
jgi:hypothetical protein